jgi:hypothetical protein
MLEVCMYRTGSLRIVVEEISKYNLNLVAVQTVRWDRGGTEPAGENTLFYRKVNHNHELGRLFFRTSAVKRVEFVSDRMSYITLVAVVKSF